MPGDAALPGIVAGLRQPGYTHNGDQGIAGRKTFEAQGRQSPYTWPRRTWLAHHLYACPADGGELRRHLAFRDALRARSDWREEYAAIKIAITARCGGDRKTCARSKEIECRGFVERVLGAPVTHGPHSCWP